MSMMDSMIVTTASTAIRSDFHISVASLQWALNAYNVTIAAVLLVGVALGNRYGHRKIYNLGMLIFVIGSILSALSLNINFLIFARIIQGMGASVLTPMSMTILTSALDPKKRGTALGIYSGIGGLGLLVGPALGGFIVAKFTWQWIFWINVPVGLIGIFYNVRKLPETVISHAHINYTDAFLVIIASTGLIWGLSDKSFRSSSIVIGLIGLLFWVLFLARQPREANPMIPLDFFRANSFTGGNISTFLLYASMYGVVFFLPQYLQLVGHANALVSGLELLPWTGTLIIIAPFAGKWVDKYGERIVASLGLLLQGLGYIWIAAISSPLTPYSHIILPLIISGAGLSMGGPALQKAVLGAVSAEDNGKASGIYNMFRLYGGAVGVAISVIVLYKFGNLKTTAAFTSGYRSVMLAAGILSLSGVLTAMLIHKNNARIAA
ncbi:DHA2 family efflux MFS transporter permease subunit [Lactobacillus sp. XV13L]|nr:DHA2 family efflux MFS transporter permease subunit [Lactobacillus sp. XV13L]